MAVQREYLALSQSTGIATICRILAMPAPRSTLSLDTSQLLASMKPWLPEIREIIERFPILGIRRVWACLVFRLKETVNRQKVARIMRLKK